ncbi:MAG: hypothetical protein ABL974_17500 [Prosthecobacter sp.]
MKAISQLITATCLMLSGSAWAQAASVVIVESAPTIEAGINNTNSALNNLLNEAKLQNDRLQQQLDRMGDPSKVNAAALDMIKNDLANNAANLKTGAERTDMLKAVKGSDAFGRETYGLMPKVEAQATLKDGTVKDRDPEKYKMESALLTDIDEARRVRDKSVQTRKELTEGLTVALDELKAAKDMASITKQSTLIQVLQGQIAAADRAASQALDDITTLEKEIALQSKVAMKAKYEEATMESKHNMELRKKSASDSKSKSATSTTGSGYKLPSVQWGGTPKTTTTTP